MKIRILPLLLCLAAGTAGCSYLHSAGKQVQYSIHQKVQPTQRANKHMLDSENYFVLGKLKNGTAANKEAIAVAAFSDRYGTNEIVDVNYLSQLDLYYGLNLPQGAYRLLVLSDLDRDGIYTEREAIGGRTVLLNDETSPKRVLEGYDINLRFPFSLSSNNSFRLEVPQREVIAESLFYPKGTIRCLDDEIFSQQMALLGMYEPAAFLEAAPMMFYALEEDVGYKVPVVFVHGMGGSARDFESIVASLDRRWFRPWFFYYPSGDDLHQLSEMFYKIFLSGKVIPLEGMPIVIVAHSMGGLIVRDALNRCRGKRSEPEVKRLITLASPLGGHPGAKNGVNAPVVLPAWRDVNPDSEFIKDLHRNKLATNLEFHLFYAFGNSSTVKFGENSDGVVPLSSQLSAQAQGEAKRQYGFNATHTGILKNSEAIQRVIEIISEIKSPFPPDHLEVLLKGGYPVELGERYSPREKYYIHTIGYYMDALVNGEIPPLPPQRHFVQACRGDKSPKSDVETAWLKFNKEFPDRRLLGNPN
ncbi:MAG TPA: alpha/beta hydrolase [Verrucomicrobia bacterium]|nr:MAG: hypothetical protein A2X46_13745 [Lentisphaerae bacterium GWF2_57_35]HBA82462.1 alpha/beta hydrolase [Verrucomicrobiota bacterium]